MRALVVDDLESGRRVVGRGLIEAGFEISYACDGLEAMERLHEGWPDVIVSDFQMPRVDGLQLLQRVREVSDVPLVMITVFGSIPDCEAAMRQGADRFLQFARDSERVGEVARGLVEAVRERVGPARAPGGRLCRASPLDQQDMPCTAEEVRARVQRELRSELQRLLVECRGNIAEMARRLGRDRSTVRYHLRRLGLLASEAPKENRRPAS
jgi:DNA-binding NtrC family response regulator